MATLKIASKTRIYGALRSKPGEPPYKQTGHLRRSVSWEYDANKMIARVGSPLAKARWLELGTRRMAARPWLRRALLESKGKIREILGVNTG
jgi:hypothetical protein